MDEVKSLLEIGQTMSFNLAWYGMACTKSPQRISFPHTHAQNVARTDSWKAILVHLFDIQNTKRFELKEIDNIDKNMADRCSLLFSSVRQFFSLFVRPTEKKNENMEVQREVNNNLSQRNKLLAEMWLKLFVVMVLVLSYREINLWTRFYFLSRAYIYCCIQLRIIYLQFKKRTHKQTNIHTENKYIKIPLPFFFRCPLFNWISLFFGGPVGCDFIVALKNASVHKAWIEPCWARTFATFTAVTD